MTSGTGLGGRHKSGTLGVSRGGSFICKCFLLSVIPHLCKKAVLGTGPLRPRVWDWSWFFYLITCCSESHCIASKHILFKKTFKFMVYSNKVTYFLEW